MRRHLLRHAPPRVQQQRQPAVPGDLVRVRFGDAVQQLHRVTARRPRSTSAGNTARRARAAAGEAAGGVAVGDLLRNCRHVRHEPDGLRAARAAPPGHAYLRRVRRYNSAAAREHGGVVDGRDGVQQHVDDGLGQQRREPQRVRKVVDEQPRHLAKVAHVVEDASLAAVNGGRQRCTMYLACRGTRGSSVRHSGKYRRSHRGAGSDDELGVGQGLPSEGWVEQLLELALAEHEYKNDDGVESCVVYFALPRNFGSRCTCTRACTAVAAALAVARVAAVALARARLVLLARRRVGEVLAILAAAGRLARAPAA